MASPVMAPLSSQRCDEVMAFAATLAAQPCPLSRPAPALWAMLTAVSSNARKRPQGSHILLQNSDHVLGRMVREASCQFDSPNVSGRHCTISRRFLGPDGRVMPPNHIPNAATDRLVACIRDSSSNGTFVNLQRLQRNGEEVQLRHGDVVSLVGTPDNETAFSFVYREVSAHVIAAAPLAALPPIEAPGQPNKRKGSPPDDAGDAVVGDGKRIKGLGNGGVSGPIMLNDVRQLQRSNEELRVLVEAHVLEVEKMRSEYRSAEARYASELKEVRAAVAEKFSAQQEELKLSLATKEAEAEASAALRLQLESNIELLQQRLASEAKSRVDAEEVIDGLKARVEELEKFLEEERSKISKERAEAEASLRAALDRIRMEAAEELKRHEETAVRQQEQQNDIILALQEGEKEYRAAAEISRKKLDSERAAVVAAEERARRLESQLQEEKVLSLSAHNRADDFEVKLRQTCRELEEEKMAREGAQGRIARLEVEMEAASRDLKLEKQRLQGAQERIVLRETQLRAFHSTAAEIADLQQRQQDQLLMMIRTLEDGDSDNDHDNHTNNLRSSTSPPTSRTPHLGQLLRPHSEPHHHQGSSQSTSRSRRSMQVDTNVGTRVGTRVGTKDEKSQGTGTAVGDNNHDDDDDITEGDETQRDGSHSTASHIPPTQVVTTQMELLCGEVRVASTYDHAGCLQRMHEEPVSLLQFAGGDLGGTQLENGDAGFTQVGDADAGCTQLLNHEAAHFEAAFRARCEVGNANKGCSTGQDGVTPRARGDGAEPMEEEEPALPDNAGVRTGDSTEHWDDGDDEGQAGAIYRRRVRESLCTADLLASEMAGSWAMATPASEAVHGETDSSSAERGCGKEPPREPPTRRASVEPHEGADCAASQVATNNLAGEKYTEANNNNHNNHNNNHNNSNNNNNAAPAGCGNEGKPTLAGDLDIEMSQTAPPRVELPQRFREPGGGAGGMVNLAALGLGLGSCGRRVAVGSDDDSDTSSTYDGSREDGEIGASELRDSEPVSPLMS